MSFADKLKLLESRGAYAPRGVVLKRWGQLIREAPSISAILEQLATKEALVPLSNLGKVHSGVVTRANAFFIVRELPFEHIPKRFNMTKRDLVSSAVVMDGLESPHRIEREYLKPIAKKLLSAKQVEESDLRLFDVACDVNELRARHHTGAATYLRRGETVSYSVSDDSLKGGIPAERAQVKNRKPYWYSLNVPDIIGSRLALPEHFDRRFIISMLPAEDKSVIIDTLYSFVAHDESDTALIWMALNSLLAWYQLELRGRTQHGEGVLKVKIPDYGGILVPNPNKVGKPAIRKLEEMFKDLARWDGSDNLDAVGSDNRILFDEEILRLVGWPKEAAARLEIERAFRAAIGERHERKVSVVDAKTDRKRVVDVTASIDSYASRLASSVESYPDPRRFVDDGAKMLSIAVVGPVSGKLTVGTELFNQGEVISGRTAIAQAPTVLAAQFVKAVLQQDPGLDIVLTPSEPSLSVAMHAWKRAAAEWQILFEKAATQQLRSIQDPRMRMDITKRATALLHADA